MHIVRGKTRVGQRDEEGAHLAGGHRVAGLDGGLAGEGGGEPFMALGVTGGAVTWGWLRLSGMLVP